MQKKIHERSSRQLLEKHSPKPDDYSLSNNGNSPDTSQLSPVMYGFDSQDSHRQEGAERNDYDYSSSRDSFSSYSQRDMNPYSDYFPNGVSNPQLTQEYPSYNAGEYGYSEYSQSGFPQGQYPQSQPSSSSKALAVFSLVCGILSLVFCWVAFLNVILGACGLIFGIVALSKVKNGNMPPSARGLSIAGTICGSIGTVISVIELILALTVAVPLFNEIINLDDQSLYDLGSLNTNIDNGPVTAFEDNSSNSSALSSSENKNASKNNDSQTNNNSSYLTNEYDNASLPGTWDSMQFLLAGKTFTLGECDLPSLRDLGWVSDNDSSEPIDEGAIRIMTLHNASYPDAFMTVSVCNTVSGSLPPDDCVITSISIALADIGGLPTGYMKLPGGLSLGAYYEDADVRTMYGDPSTADYGYYFYKSSDKEMDLGLDEGICDQISLSL